MNIGNALCAIALLATQSSTRPNLPPPNLPPPPPPLQLTAAEDAAMRGMIARWTESRRVKTSPLVITEESFPYQRLFEPLLRLELLRHGVDATLTEQLLTSLRDRNVTDSSMRSPSLGNTTRIRFIDVLLRGMDPKTASDASLQNLGAVRAVAVPGTAADSAIVFYGVGPQMLNTMYNTAHLAFVRKGVVVWDKEFGRRGLTVGRDAANAPKSPTITTDDLAVINAVLDKRFPDRKTVPLVVNETRMFTETEILPPVNDELTPRLIARNPVPYFLTQLDVTRHIQLVGSEKLMWSASDVAGSPGVIHLSLPAYSDDLQRAAVRYTTEFPIGGADIEGGIGTVYLSRGNGGWVVNRDTYAMAMTTKGDPNAPIRVGGDVKAPIVLKRVEPVFPPGTRKGILMMEMTIDRDGHVVNVLALTTRGAAADQAAIDAVRQWRFQPGTLNGQPVPVIYNVVVNVP